jgi:hypothetical protein
VSLVEFPHSLALLCSLASEWYGLHRADLLLCNSFKNVTATRSRLLTRHASSATYRGARLSSNLSASVSVHSRLGLAEQHALQSVLRLDDWRILFRHLQSMFFNEGPMICVFNEIHFLSCLLRLKLVHNSLSRCILILITGRRISTLLAATCQGVSGFAISDSRPCCRQMGDDYHTKVLSLKLFEPQEVSYATR